MAVADWFRKNLMSLNILKTYYINFSARSRCHRDMGDLGAIISCTNYSKFLSLTIQSNMSWDEDIKHLIKKLNTACYMIRNVKQNRFHENIKKCIFVIFPFCHDIWHNVLG
jgi:hypothetical protein